MSADNYAICPRCLAEARAYATATLDMLRDRGVPEETISKLTKGALDKVNPEDYRTWREEYQFYGASSGFITVDYYGECQECGLSLSFEDEHRIRGLDGLDLSGGSNE